MLTKSERWRGNVSLILQHRSIAFINLASKALCHVANQRYTRQKRRELIRANSTANFRCCRQAL